VRPNRYARSHHPNSPPEPTGDPSTDDLPTDDLPTDDPPTDDPPTGDPPTDDLPTDDPAHVTIPAIRSTPAAVTDPPVAQHRNARFRTE